MTVKCITNNPIAYDSPDHLVPVGTKNDNSTLIQYIEEVESMFGGKKINYMDIGCAGGQLAVDFHNRGHFSVGIEGSDTSIKFKLHNWPKYHNSVLFTADITKPYHIEKDGEKVLFDAISAWEVVEHIHPTDLDTFFQLILSNLKPGGIFVGTINLGPDVRRDEHGNLHYLHQSVFLEQYWREKILNKYNVSPYPFKGYVRVMYNSFAVMITKEQE